MLSELEWLREIYLDGNQITDMGIKYLEGITSLRALSLEDNFLTAEGEKKTDSISMRRGIRQRDMVEREMKAGSRREISIF